MKSLTLTIVIIGGGIFALFAIADYIERRGRPTREMSKMMSVRHVLHSPMSDYYEKNGKYPDTLADLALDSIEWGDEGSSKGDLEDWRYFSEGTRFTMTWQHPEGLQLFFGGDNGHYYYQEADSEKKESQQVEDPNRAGAPCE